MQFSQEAVKSYNTLKQNEVNYVKLYTTNYFVVELMRSKFIPTKKLMVLYKS